MTVDSGIGLLVDFVRATALIESAVRRELKADALQKTFHAVTKIRIIERDVWILVVMNGSLDWHAVRPCATRSCASVAAQLGFNRETVAMRMAILLDGRLVKRSKASGSNDRRERFYSLTPAGKVVADRLLAELQHLEGGLRAKAWVKSNARAVDPQRVAIGLADSRQDDIAPWLERRRVREGLSGGSE